MADLTLTREQVAAIAQGDFLLGRGHAADGAAVRGNVITRIALPGAPEPIGVREVLVALAQRVERAEALLRSESERMLQCIDAAWMGTRAMTDLPTSAYLQEYVDDLRAELAAKDARIAEREQSYADMRRERDASLQRETDEYTKRSKRIAELEAITREACNCGLQARLTATERERDEVAEAARRYRLERNEEVIAGDEAAKAMNAENDRHIARIAELEAALRNAKSHLLTVGITGSREKAETARERIDAALKGGA